MKQVKVAIQTTEPISLAGLTSYLASDPGIAVLPAGQRHLADVAVVAVDRLTPEVVAGMRRAAAEVGAPVVLVPDSLGETDVMTAVKCRVVAVLPKAAATADRLVHAVHAAARGDGVLPPSMIGALIKDAERMQRELLELNRDSGVRLSEREEKVIRLLAEGLDTGEIAAELSYSERTVKNVIFAVTSRYKLRNRPHAVAYAVRAGLI